MIISKLVYQGKNTLKLKRDKEGYIFSIIFLLVVALIELMYLLFVAK